MDPDRPDRAPPSGDDLDRADAALAAALLALAGGAGADARLDREGLAQRTGVPAAVLEAVERQGLLFGRGGDGETYTEEDAEAVRAGLALLEAGLPLDELLALARRLDAALREVADHAVEVFLRYVRDPIHADASSADEAAGRLVGAFERMLPAATRLAGHHFRGVLLERARVRLEQRRAGDRGR